MKYLAISACAFAMTISSALSKTLTDDQVTKFARLALDGIVREYPNKPSNVISDPAGVRSPREMHPVFYGSFDWHSSLHGHWMLIRLLKQFPDASVADEIRKTLNQQLTAEGLQAETDYFDEKYNASFERMYGWAWTLRMAAELHEWNDKDGATWAKHFAPLENKIVELATAYLPKLDWPIRMGIHPDSAFALSQFLDYARTKKNTEFEKLIIEKATAFYAKDENYPAAYEPSGNDFFSAGLNEADLMRRILTKAEFSSWLKQFFPDLAEGKCGNLLTPVSVSDVNDGHLVHLAGLNLSRAWTMQGILSALDKEDPRSAVLEKAKESHSQAGQKYVFSGSYEGEHWLASFAIYLLTGV